MTDETYVQERKFLAKNYKAFLYDYLQELKSGNDPLHIHPPPAFRHVYDIIIHHFVKRDEDELSTTDLVSMMDMVAKFVSYLNDNKIEYNGFTSCECTTLTARDVELLLESGGDNR